MASNTPLPNAFTINRLGPPDGWVSFPFALSCHEMSPGAYGISLWPVRVIDICDLLRRYPALVVYGVDAMDLLAEADGPKTLQRVAAQGGIDHRAIDANTLIVTADALCDLVDGLGHWNLHAFDWQADQTEYDLIANVLAASDERRPRGESVLTAFSRARFFLDSHDDCYLLLQCYDLSLPKAVFGRMLRIYVGTVLAEHMGFEGVIAEVLDKILDRVWPSDSALTILRRETRVSGERVRIGASTREFDFLHDQPYPTAFLIEYNSESGQWGVTS